MSVILGFFLLCALLSAAIAQQNRRSPIGGFLAGLLFGPLAVAGFLIAGQRGKPCPHCRERIDAQATVCPRCTRELPSLPRKP